MIGAAHSVVITVTAIISTVIRRTERRNERTSADAARDLASRGEMAAAIEYAGYCNIVIRRIGAWKNATDPALRSAPMSNASICVNTVYTLSTMTSVRA